MLRRFIHCCGKRNFSRSNIRLNTNLTKSSEPQKPPEPEKYDSMYDFIPTEYDKIVLVWSGRYKNRESIPKRVSISTLNTAKSRLRIKISNWLMIGILGIAAVYIWHAKNLTKQGESLISIATRLDEEIIEKGKQERLKKSNEK